MGAQCRKKAKISDWDAVEATPSVSRWDATPGRAADATPGGATPGGATPGATPGAGGRWDATPGRGDSGSTPARRNRWDETPTPRRVRYSRLLYIWFSLFKVEGHMLTA